MDQHLDVLTTERPAMDAPIPYVCMPGSPYTGSTLLGMLWGITRNAHRSARPRDSPPGSMSRRTSVRVARDSPIAGSGAASPGEPWSSGTR